MTEATTSAGLAFVLEHFADEVIEQDEFRGQPWVTVGTGAIHEVIRRLKEEAGFLFLDDLTAVDYLDRPEVEGRFRVVYHLLDMKTRELFRVKAWLEDEDEEVPTVSDLFGTADWLEREVYDMFGIVFSGHPDLRRILMSSDYEDFPLRRDFPWHGRVPLMDPMREQDYRRGVEGEHPY
jgi:NADH-quinone oxidoreductase subunit C